MNGRHGKDGELTASPRKVTDVFGKGSESGVDDGSDLER